MKKRIFTFWEPKNNIPGYIQLCLKTWKKFLPEYEIVVCDYENLSEYLTKEEIHQFLYKKFPLQQQSDALRTILLKRYGGIWLDADTILTSSKFFEELKDVQCAMIGSEKDKALHIAFILAQKNSIFIQKWADTVQKKILVYKRFSRLSFLQKLFKAKKRELHNWDYLGNSIIEPLKNQMNSQEFFLIDRNEIGAFPEMLQGKNNPPQELYQNFYFTGKIQPDDILNQTKGIILLHNSWTPEKFKQKSMDEFVKQDIPLANLLKTILGENFND